MEPASHAKARRLIAPLAVAALVVALVASYWPSLSLPLSFDDAWSVRMARDFTLFDLFTRTQNFGYYQPLYLAYYRLAAAAGASGPLLLHVSCIVAHAANTLLLLKFMPAMLGRQTGGMAFGAAFLFALNPFAVQAVALPAGLNHLLALLFIQLAMLCYACARQSGPTRRRAAWWVTCLGLCTLAFLSNEIGLSVAGFALTYEAIRAVRTRRWAREAWSFLIVVGLAGAYAVLYQLMPKGASPEWTFAFGDAMTRALIALQTLTYPLTLLLSPLGLPAEVAVLLATALLLSLCALALRGGMDDAALLGLLLFAASVALPVLRLPTGYVQNAPRVFYLASVGVAITWASLVWALAARLVPRIRVALIGTVIATLGLAGAWHVRDHQALLARANEPVQAIALAGAQLTPGDQLLVINAPEWVAPPARRFPMFSEGAIVLADYVEGSDLTLANTGLDRDVRLVRLALPGHPSRPYAFQTFGEPFDSAQLHNAARVLQTHYLSEGLRTDWIGGATEQRPAQTVVTFAGGPALAQYHIQPCREGWVVALQWRGSPSARELAPTLSAFVQALDANGAKLAQSDGAPLQGLLPFAQLPLDRDIVDRRMLIAPGAAGATLYVGLYDYVTGERLPATDAQGVRLDGDALALALSPPDPNIVCR
ncbi:hypothetical protein [Candidatus Roseilinea sp. NK_OTU-006]|jgi:hypothetical protein|uniref:hypothetical protein n=1 Tax=Candidatus Roseilinea sp. NK_OTU-006 TaxID=2704250 RepID=UPI00145E3A23|nr:hypothetical protein [Candidatus Roseilinea sp. NK_OTU-006]